ncbi:MAG: VOC family protein [Planctomycetes bacterium]|nr:VOC family protein [Planctomycetota bacterium]
MSQKPQTTKPAPPGWPRISSALFYDDANAAIDWLCAAFGFEIVLKVAGEDGKVEHSELRFGEGLVMVADTGRQGHDGRLRGRSPRAIDGGNTQSLAIYVDDVDAHCEAARAGGATILQEPQTTDYGAEYWSDRSYLCADPEGHLWWFMQRMRTGTPA